MDELLWLVVFAVGQQRFAVHLKQVRKVVFAAELTPVPGAPAAVRGVLDFHGEVVAVVDVRRLLGLPARDILVTDQFVIVDSGSRTLALLVDEALGVVQQAASRVTRVDANSQFTGAVTLNDGLVLIHDIEGFLSEKDAHTLDTALEAMP